MNNICIIGRVSKDIEISTIGNGVKVARFNVAVPNEYKSKTGERKADFFSCVAWRDAAENIAKYFKKGSVIGLIGSMNTREWEKDGEKRIMWELNVKSFSFLGSKYSEMGEGAGKDNRPEPIPVEDDKDCPF